MAQRQTDSCQACADYDLEACLLRLKLLDLLIGGTLCSYCAFGLLYVLIRQEVSNHLSFAHLTELGQAQLGVALAPQ